MTMYALKPIISMPGADIYKLKTMYEMKNIHGARGHEEPSNHTPRSHENKIVSDIAEQVIKFLKSPLPEVAELEIRQEKILAQLAELKNQVSSLCGILKSSNQNKSTSTSTTARSNKEKISLDLVVNANTSKPPYSILAIRNIWKDTDVKITPYKHSSTTPPFHDFPIGKKTYNNSQNNSVDVSLIWKKVTDLEVVISGVRGTPLVGEVNLLRYLSRMIESQSYEIGASAVESLKIDSVLDLCHELSFVDSHKAVNLAFSTLGSKLGSSRWLVGRSEPSIADVAAWSTIKRLDHKKLPGNLAGWFARCNDLFWPK